MFATHLRFVCREDTSQQVNVEATVTKAWKVPTAAASQCHVPPALTALPGPNRWAFGWLCTTCIHNRAPRTRLLGRNPAQVLLQKLSWISKHWNPPSSSQILVKVILVHQGCSQVCLFKQVVVTSPRNASRCSVPTSSLALPAHSSASPTGAREGWGHQAKLPTPFHSNGNALGPQSRTGPWRKLQILG